MELGNPDYLPDSHLIHLEKRRKVYAIISDIQRYQRVPFHVDPETKEIPHYWEGPVWSEQEQYARSLIVEPRDDDEDDE